MSEYTREEILKLIEENGGPARLRGGQSDQAVVVCKTLNVANRAQAWYNMHMFGRSGINGGDDGMYSLQRDIGAKESELYCYPKGVSLDY
jgi:hypothetical protein